MTFVATKNCFGELCDPLKHLLDPSFPSGTLSDHIHKISPERHLFVKLVILWILTVIVHYLLSHVSQKPSNVSCKFSLQILYNLVSQRSLYIQGICLACTSNHEV